MESNLNISTVELVDPTKTKKRAHQISKGLVCGVFCGVVIGCLLYFLVINRANEKHREEGNKAMPFAKGVIDEKHREELMEKDGEEFPFLKEMVEDMDKTADPCNNFFQYACGGYIKRHSGPSSTYYADRFINLQKKNYQIAKGVIESIQIKGSNNGALDKAAKYYSSCMANGASLRGLSAYWMAFNDVGGGPIGDSQWSESSWSLIKALQKLHLNYGAYPLFRVTVMPDLKDTSQHILMVNFPDMGVQLTEKIGERNPFDVMFGSEDMDFENQLETLQRHIKSYSTNVKDVFALAASAQFGRLLYSVESDLTDAIHLEKNIMKQINLNMKGRKIHTLYERTTVKELTSFMRNTFSWKEFLGGLVSGVSKAPVSDDTKVALMVPRAFLSYIADQLDELFLFFSTPKKTWANYFAWILLKKLSPALPDTYFNAYHNPSLKKGQERWRYCLQDTETNMPLTVGLMFVEKSVTESKRNQTLRLLNGVREAFEKGVYKVGWLDARTRDGAIIKVANMIDIIAVPSFATDRKTLEQRYAGVVQSANTATFLISCQKNLVRNNLRLLDVPAKRTEWGTTSSKLALYMVNAFYDRTKNRMVVLGGIMAEPFLYDNVPNYINFGKLGAVIGHEMLHGFDSHGWYFDKNGNIAPWGTPDAQKAFNRNSKCLVEQYSKYPYGTVTSLWSLTPQPYYVNGTQTLAENIADNGGLKYAYQAYMDWAAKNPSEKKPESLKLNQKQLFFLSYGQLWCRAISDNLKSIIAKRDTHSPNMYRVLGSVTNFKEFGKAYSCRSGSKMNPTRRCEFW